MCWRIAARGCCSSPKRCCPWSRTCSAGCRISSMSWSPAPECAWLQATVGRTRRRKRCIRDGGHACRRTGLLALFVGLDRHAQGRAASAFQSRGDRGNLCQTGARHSRGRRWIVGGQAVFRLWTRQRADLSDVGRRHHGAQFRTPDAGGDVRADEQISSEHFLRRADAVRGDAQRRDAGQGTRRQPAP